MGKELVIFENVERELQKIGTFEEIKIAELYNQSNDLITIFVIKSEDTNFWKIRKNGNIVNILLCKDYEFERLVKIFS